MRGWFRLALAAFILVSVLAATVSCRPADSRDTGVVATVEQTVTPTSRASASPTPVPLTPTPTEAASTAEIEFARAQADFGENDRPILRGLRAAPLLPANVELPPLAEWQVRLVPTNARLRLAQNTLFPDASLGNPAGGVTTYLVYGYTRGEDLGKSVLNMPVFGAVTQEVIVTARVYVEVDGQAYLVEETLGIGGAGEDSIADLVPAAVEPSLILGELATTVESVLEQIIDAATGGSPADDVTDSDALGLLEMASGSPHWPDRTRAVGNLPYTRMPVGSAALLVKRLDDSESRVQEAAWRVLEDLAEDHEQVVVDALVQGLGHWFQPVRDGIAFRFEAAYPTMAGPARDGTVSSLTRMLEESDWQTRALGAWGLGEMGERAAAAGPNLAAALADESPWVRRAAASALGQIGDTVEGAVGPALAARFSDQNEVIEVREAAAYALGRLGPRASDYLSVFVEALGDEDDRVRASAVRRLVPLGAPDSEALIVKALDDLSPRVRGAASYSMALLDPTDDVIGPRSDG